MDLFGLLHGYTKINCPFGKRVAPTTGASTYHKGIDIGAPEGSYFVAVCDGEITFTKFLGGRWLYYNFIYWQYENLLLSCWS